MKNFKLILTCFFVFFLLLPIVSVAYADNSNPFVFITDPQSVAPGVPSSVISVQSQDPSGAGFPIGNGAGDTADVVFTSTSPTGQFLNSSGGAVTKTMSYSSYTKNFYYQDSTVGVYTLTVTATTRTSQKIFTASQQIYIGQPIPGGGSSDDTASTTDDTTAGTTDQTAGSNSDNSGNNGASSSANSSPASISNSAVAVDFQISAGRDRLTSVGNELLFVVTPTKTQNILSNLIGYTWSFGDGSTGEGESVHHAYKFPGQYSVVVNATASDQIAVDRLTVKVVDPQITLLKIDGGLEIKNNSGAEINLEGWKLVLPTKSFTFPTDTLIPAGHSVTFADETTGINSGDLQLQNPLGKTYAGISGPGLVMVADVVASTGTTGTKSLDEISQSVSDVAQKLAILKSEMNSSTSTENSPSAPAMSASGRSVPAVILTTVPTTPIVATTDVSSTTDNIDQTATVFEAPSSPGVISRIFSWPIAGINFIRNLFIEN